MFRKNRLILLVAGVVAILAIIIGCSTDEPWAPDPSRPLGLIMVSAPDDSTLVPNNSSVGFVWTSTGGSGKINLYEWYLASASGDTLATNESAWANSDSGITSFTYDNLYGGTNTDTIGIEYTFHVKVKDSENSVDSLSTSFTVAPDTATIPSDTDTPTFAIDQALKTALNGAFIAVGSNLTFSWTGEDGNNNEDDLEYQVAFPTIDDTSAAWTIATSVIYNNVAAADPAKFFVRCRDQAGNTTDWDSLYFVVKAADILYIDDYLFLNGWGDTDAAKERDQKEFYRSTLNRYAMAEWDYHVFGMPDSTDLVVGGNPVYSTIIWCSDSEVGNADGTWWYDIVGGDGLGVLYHYLESGGNLIVTGSMNLPWMYNNNPPVSGDIEYDWLGISDDTTIIGSIDTVGWWYDRVFYDVYEVFDTLGVAPDSIVADTTIDAAAWDYEWWFTTATKDTLTELDLPSSMTLDISKNGSQDDYATGILQGVNENHFRDDGTVTVEPIFRWGPWVDGSLPGSYYGTIVGHITTINGAARTAMLNFDTYSMPVDGMRQTFRAILREFGE